MYYFIYKTTNLINNKTYVGMHKTNDLNDGYLGSGLAFKDALKKYGKDNFKREILKFTDSYESLIELEKLYVTEDLVNDRNNYNLKTGGQSHGLLSNESKIKISNTLKHKYKTGEIKPKYEAPYEMTDKHKKQISETLKERYKTVEHPTTGKEPWNKGKKGVQIPWNKGKKGVQDGWSKDLKLGPLSEEHKNNISNSLKEYYKNNPNPMLGKDAWNKGKKMDQIECPHCGKMVDKGNGNRWHFDNCKMKIN
jgi:hypothetical protein